MDSLNLFFLGTFHAQWQDVSLTRFRSDKIRALFAYLAVEPDVPHRRETLATMLWPDHSNAIALRNLRKSLHRLKKTLDEYDPTLSERLLSIDRQTVTWNGEHSTLDAHRFVEIIAAVEKHPHRSLKNCPDCLSALDKAIALYQGDFLAGISISNAIGFEEWVVIKRERLHQQVLSSLQSLSTAHEQMGSFNQSHTYAMRQISLEPWREEAHRQLMRVLASQGEYSRALKQYQLCCSTLKEELGALPSSETVQLYEQIHQGEFPAPTADHSINLHHFPTQFAPFVGRAGEIETISEHLLDESCRLLTVTGPGGVGKTRLILESVQHFVDQHSSIAKELVQDGCYFIPLAGLLTQNQLIIAIENALQFSFQAAENLEDQLIAFLATKHLLIVLDNFEQLVDVAHDLIDRLLRSAPSIKLLISSRESLQLQAERQLRLEGLVYPDTDQIDVVKYANQSICAYDGISLFVQTAQHALPNFKPTEADLASIIHICQLTQGTPLALEIAAVWIKTIGCQAIANQIMQNLDFLSTTQRGKPDRHKSMRAVFEQSWSSLSKTDQVTLAQISIFRGGFTLEAALFVLDDALQALSTLLDKSLLRKDEKGRYQIHTLLQQFAAEKLSMTDPTLSWQAEDRHCQYYFNLILAQSKQFSQTSTGIQFELIQIELDNLRHAWNWATIHSQWDRLLEVMDGFDLFYHVPSSYTDTLAIINFALNQAQAELQHKHEHDARAQQLLIQLRIQKVKLLLEQRKFKQARQLAQDNCDECRLYCKKEQLPVALADLGISHWRLGDFLNATIALNESLALAQALTMPFDVAYALHHLGNIAIVQKEYEKAHKLLSQAMALYEEAGNSYHLANVLNDLGSLNFASKKLDLAQIYYQKSLDYYRQVNSISGCILPLNNLIYISLVLEDYASAKAHCDVFKKFATENHIDLAYTPYYLTNKGHISLMLKEYPQATKDYKKRLCSSQLPEEKIEILLGLIAIIIAKHNQTLASQLLAVVDHAWANNPPIVSPFEWQLFQWCKDNIDDSSVDLKPDKNYRLGADEAILIALAEIDSTEEISLKSQKQPAIWPQ